MTLATVDETPDTLGPFARDLASRVRILDLAALAIVPVVLVGVFLLPEATKRALAFQYTDPTLLTAYSAHFVHLRAPHLVGNLVGYVLLVSVCYALALLARRRRFFMTALATFLLAFPVLLSALNLAVPRHAIGYGFSGINMALLGVLPLLLVAYTREQFFPCVHQQYAPALFFLVIAGVSLLALPMDDVVLFVTAASALIGAAYVATLRESWRRSPDATIRQVVARSGYGDLLALGVTLFVTYPLVGFPSDPATSGQVLNLYVHVLGFCLAFIGPYVLLTAGVFDGAE